MFLKNDETFLEEVTPYIYFVQNCLIQFVWKKNRTMILSKTLAVNALIAVLVLSMLLSLSPVSAVSYQSTWPVYLKNDPQRRHWADISAECMFPNRVKVGDKFQVQVALRYIKNENSTLLWIEFFDINVQTRKLPTGQDVTISKFDSSRLRVTPGNQYSGTFSLDAPPDSGDYYVAFVCKTYDPGAKMYNMTKPSEELQWDSGTYSDIFNARLVVQKSQATLTIRLENIKTAEIKLQGETQKIEDGELKLKLSTDASYTLEMPKQIDVDSGTRALFVRWSSGETSNIRTIIFTDDLTVSAVYKVQFLLTVNSEMGNPQGGGWYDSGTTVTFSVNSPVSQTGLAGFFGAKSIFDHWTGGSTSTSPTGTIRMIGPRVVTAVWKSSSLFGMGDSYLVQILGGIGTGGSILLGWLFATRKRRLASSYLTKIDSVYAQHSMNREACREHLMTLRNEITVFFRKGKIDASQFAMLDGKLERYLKDLT